MIGGGPDDAALVTQAIAGDETAFERLRAGAERGIRGYLRVRVRRDDDVDDLLQETWLQVWQKLPTYDPARSRFSTFARFWADILVRRYWDTAQGKGTEIPFSAGLGLGGGGDDDADDADRIDRLAARGQEAFPAPDNPVDAAVYDDLLAITFATASPPHQLIAFGFVKAADWRPRQIAADLSDVSLDDLEQQLEAAYLDQSDLPAERVEPAFEPLRARLGQRFDEAVRDPTTLTTYPNLRARIVGETTLADYYTGDPTADITQWWYAVKRRVLAEVQRRASGPLADLLKQVQRRSAAGQPAGKGASRRADG